MIPPPASEDVTTSDFSTPLAPTPPARRRQKVSVPSVLTAYRRMAPVYDWVFGACFQQGRRRAIASLAPAPGERVLEVGIGTGLTLRHWPAHAQVTGIDLSPEMLQRAERMKDRHQLRNVQLRLMNAQAMDFPDNSFDKIAAMYVVSVAPDLNALLREVQRVCVPGGRICIVNHFEQSNPWLRRMETSLSRHAGLLGFDSALPLKRVVSYPGFRVLQVRPVNWGGYWAVVELENVK